MGDSGEDTPGKGANGEKKGRRISFKSLSSKEKAKKWMAGEDTYGPGITDAEAEKAAHVAEVELREGEEAARKQKAAFEEAHTKTATEYVVDSIAKTHTGAAVKAAGKAAGKAAKHAVNLASSDKGSSAWESANAMCTDTSYQVPMPPDLAQAKAAIAELKKKRIHLFPGEDRKIIQRIKSTTWARAQKEAPGVSTPYMGTVNPNARTRPLPGFHPDHPLECLVFKGGGAKGSIYPGAVRALEEAGVMPYIKRFAGASAGSIVAALLAVGLSADQLFHELSTTDLAPIVLDGKAINKVQLFSKFGMHPGHGLYVHLGMLFYKYTGCADVTFKDLYDHFGVELAVTVTNISRAASEVLHVKTAPDYPIRKAVRASMSLPVAIQPARDRNIHTVVSEHVHEIARQMESSGETHMIDSTAGHSGTPASAAKGSEPLELYVDGGVLNNYPIDTFDGWWLSMDKDDAFFRKVVGEGGHKNYVERFGTYDAAKGVRKINPHVMGFRLASSWEPDAFHSRLGNDALELRVRGTEAAKLPDTTLATKYAPFRFSITAAQQSSLKLEKDLRASMTWIKQKRDEARAAAASDAEAKLDVAALAAKFADPPAELVSALGIGEGDDPATDIAERLRHHHFLCRAVDAQGRKLGATKGAAPTRQALDLVLETEGWASRQIKALYQRKDMADAPKLAAIQTIVRAAQGECPGLLEACDELEELLESSGDEVMKKLCGMAPKEVTGFMPFLTRMLDAIQMTNDEKVQTKENYSRTCMLNTEYVGTMDFKLEDADHYFLWRKGFLSAMLWLEKRTSKAKDKKKKVAKAMVKEMKKQAAESDDLEAAKKASQPPAAAAAAPAGAAAAAKEEPAAKKAGGAADFKAQAEKVLSNAALSDAEKLDILQRRLAAAQ